MDYMTDLNKARALIEDSLADLEAVLLNGGLNDHQKLVVGTTISRLVSADVALMIRPPAVPARLDFVPA